VLCKIDPHFSEGNNLGEGPRIFGLTLNLLSALIIRDVVHGLLIDVVTSELHKRTFINRMLFSNILLLSVGLLLHVLYFFDLCLY